MQSLEPCNYLSWGAFMYNSSPDYADPPPPPLDFVYLFQKNFDNMCVKTDVDIVDNIRNIPHLQKKIGPKKIRLYVCQKQRRHCRQILHQNISKW